MPYSGEGGGGGGGGVSLIADTTLAVDTATFDIAGIVASFSTLRLVVMLRGTTAAQNIEPRLRFNNDSGANYHWSLQAQTDTGAGGTTLQGTGDTSFRLGVCPAASANASSAMRAVIEIPFYAGATFFQTVQGIGAASDASAGLDWTFQSGGTWRGSPAAVTRVTLLPNTGSWKTGSRVQLYGLT